MFPERLRQLRIEQKMSQEELGRLLSVAKGTVSMYETGKRQPDYETLGILAGAFGVSVDWLLGRTDIRDIPSEEELLARLPSDIKAAFRGRSWHDLDPETRRHIAWAISLDLAQLKARQAQEEPEARRTE